MSTPTPLTNDLAARLKERRDALILTQREVAELLGVSERTLQNWEAGVSLPRQRHRRAIEAFMVDDEVAA